MRRPATFRSELLASILCVAAGSQSAAAKDPALQSLTLEHFRDTAVVHDNPADGVATISTEKGFVEHTGLLRMVWSDEYLTGTVDRKTGQKSFAVRAMVIYSGRLRSYESVTYPAAGQSTPQPVTQLGKQAANCPVGDCTYTEKVEFSVDEGVLRRIAAASVPGNPMLWTFKLIAHDGADYRGQLSDAEIAGFLRKVDDYANTVPAVTAAAATASLGLDFGVNGVPVDAAAETPHRAGVLVIGVERGSVAARAGLIVGDIIHEFAGRPVTSLESLQSAVAACAPRSAAAIKLWRGTGELRLTAQF